MMEVVDLFSGLGGFSQAFLDRGHEVERYDNNPKFSQVPNTKIIRCALLSFMNETDLEDYMSLPQKETVEPSDDNAIIVGRYLGLIKPTEAEKHELKKEIDELNAKLQRLGNV